VPGPDRVGIRTIAPRYGRGRDVWPGPIWAGSAPRRKCSLLQTDTDGSSGADKLSTAPATADEARILASRVRSRTARSDSTSSPMRSTSRRPPVAGRSPGPLRAWPVTAAGLRPVGVSDHLRAFAVRRDVLALHPARDIAERDPPVPRRWGRPTRSCRQVHGLNEMRRTSTSAANSAQPNTGTRIPLCRVAVKNEAPTVSTATTGAP